MFVVSATSAAADRERRDTVAVIRKSPPDYFLLGNFAADLVIENRELERRFNRFRSAAGEIETREPRRSPSREPLDQPLPLPRAPNRHDIVERRDSARRHLRDFLAPLPNIDDHRARACIKNLVAVRGIEPRPFGALNPNRIMRSAHEHRWLL